MTRVNVQNQIAQIQSTGTVVTAKAKAEKPKRAAKRKRINKQDENVENANARKVAKQDENSTNNVKKKPRRMTKKEIFTPLPILEAPIHFHGRFSPLIKFIN